MHKWNYSAISTPTDSVEGYVFAITNKQCVHIHICYQDKSKSCEKIWKKFAFSVRQGRTNSLLGMIHI